MSEITWKTTHKHKPIPATLDTIIAVYGFPRPTTHAATPHTNEGKETPND